MAAPAPATEQGVANTQLSKAALDTAINIGSLTDKVALITGGSSGLGRAIAQAYAAAGAYVVSADLTPNPPKAPFLEDHLKSSDLTTPTVDLVNNQHSAKNGKPAASYTTCNVTEAQSVEAAVAFTVQTYGRLDIMVNNAGISAELTHPEYAKTGHLKRIHETDVEALDRTWAVNGKGVWLGCKYAAAQMLTQEPHSSGDRGWIINMASILGMVGMPGSSTYCATKGAVIQITKSVALEYAADKVHVLAICPGFTETNILEPMRSVGGVDAFHAMINAAHPWGRLGLPEEIARVAVFLAGPGASWMTGTTIEVAGGYTAQ